VSEIVSSQIMEQLRALSTCDVANAIERLKVRLRNEGFTNDVLRHFGGGTESVIGRAVTVRIRCSAPPTDGHDYLESTQWWNYVLSVPGPRLVIIEDVDPFPGTGALVGEIHANILRALGCVGVVTNGAIRDLPALQAMAFHAYARRLAVSHAYSHIVEMGAPVEIAGLKISSGDLLHGDAHGLISIPAGSAVEIIAMARKLAEREKTILELCRREQFSVEPLREAIRAFRREEA
jgi:4-hydroxy-4-methyl-2-oxoglutarate aldolase